ncbi:MAG: hypothetical protein ACXVB2_12835 [Isosphaeraceae bacterium]
MFQRSATAPPAPGRPTSHPHKAFTSDQARFKDTENQRQPAASERSASRAAMPIASANGSE